MNKDKNTGIGKIKYGEIHSYYPFYIDSRVDGEEIAKKIFNSYLSFNKKFKENEMKKLRADFPSLISKKPETKYNTNLTTDSIDDIMEKLQLGKAEQFLIENGEYCFQLIYDGDFNILRNDVSLTVLSESNKDYNVSINVASIKNEFILQHDKIRDFENRHLIAEGGYEWLLVQDQISLLPLRIEFVSGEEIYIPVTLIIFSNNMCVIKISYPIINTDVTALKEGNYEKYIESIYFEKAKRNFDNILNFVNYLIKEISIFLDSECISATNIVMDYIYLLKCDGMEKDILNISDNVKRDIYSILVSPITEYSEDTLRKNQIDTFLSNQLYSKSGINTYLRNNGGGLILLDEYFIQKFMESNRISNHKYDFEDEYINKLIISNAVVANEYSTIITLLKRLNIEITFFNQILSNNPKDEAYVRYLKNKLYINQIQEHYAMTSINEDVDFFEKKMPFYTTKKYINEKINILDEIMSIRSEAERERYNSFFVKGALLVTLIFGLQAINGTLKLIRKEFLFIHDVPLITIGFLSFIVWVLVTTWVSARGLYDKNPVEFIIMVGEGILNFLNGSKKDS